MGKIGKGFDFINKNNNIKLPDQEATGEANKLNRFIIVYTNDYEKNIIMGRLGIKKYSKVIYTKEDMNFEEN